MSPLLTASGIGVAFGHFQALSGVDLEVEEGELHALCGPNGAGKSTFINVLGGQLLQTAGEVIFAGRSLGRTTPHQRARLGIGRSFQLTSIVAGFSCLENVVLAIEAERSMLGMLRLRARSEDVRRADELLDLVGLRSRSETPAEELGHGQQKQLEVAIALGRRPRLLLLDEPTSGLTERERHSLSDLLKRVVERSTIVMAEHDVEFVRRTAGRVTALNLGRKIAEGAPDEVFENHTVKEVFLRGASAA